MVPGAQRREDGALSEPAVHVLAACVGDRKISFCTSANPDDLNPEGDFLPMTIKTHGSGLEVPIPISIALRDSTLELRCGQMFSVLPDGSGLRQLTDSRGLVEADDGTFIGELPGQWAYGPYH